MFKRTDKSGSRFVDSVQQLMQNLEVFSGYVLNVSHKLRLTRFACHDNHFQNTGTRNTFTCCQCYGLNIHMVSHNHVIK